jgi:hypothetical protein
MFRGGLSVFKCNLLVRFGATGVDSLEVCSGGTGGTKRFTVAFRCPRGSGPASDAMTKSGKLNTATASAAVGFVGSSGGTSPFSVSSGPASRSRHSGFPTHGFRPPLWYSISLPLPPRNRSNLNPSSNRRGPIQRLPLARRPVPHWSRFVSESPCPAPPQFAPCSPPVSEVAHTAFFPSNTAVSPDPTPPWCSQVCSGRSRHSSMEGQRTGQDGADPPVMAKAPREPRRSNTCQPNRVASGA